VSRGLGDVYKRQVYLSMTKAKRDGLLNTMVLRIQISKL
jgi:hypothetical protein